MRSSGRASCSAWWWIFGEKVDLAFGSWIVPVLDLIFLPWTTLAYVIAWQPGGADGNREAALVVLGIAMNVATYLHRFAAKSVQTRRAGDSPLRDTTRSIS